MMTAIEPGTGGTLPYRRHPLAVDVRAFTRELSAPSPPSWIAPDVPADLVQLVPVANDAIEVTPLPQTPAEVPPQPAFDPLSIPFRRQRLETAHNGGNRTRDGVGPVPYRRHPVSVDDVEDAMEVIRHHDALVQLNALRIFGDLAPNRLHHPAERAHLHNVLIDSPQHTTLVNDANG